VVTVKDADLGYDHQRDIAVVCECSVIDGFPTETFGNDNFYHVIPSVARDLMLGQDSSSFGLGMTQKKDSE